jgi:fructoselysine-6-P-deglycase FrlB-like protein
MDCRHGPMVMIGKSTLVIASLSDGGEQEQRLIADVAKKNALIVTCTDEPLKLPKVYLNVSFGKKLDNIGRGLALLVVCQYTAYYKALVKGLNPDSPAGLDAWIKL